MSVGIVVVSHSEKIASGIVELSRQMAATTRIIAAGGMDDGGIGTSFERVQAALAEADDGDGVVVLCDLGSAILTAETVTDFLDEDVRARVRIADAPIVEGTVAAAVEAEGGGSLELVLAAGESAAGSKGSVTGDGTRSEPGDGAQTGSEQRDAEPGSEQRAADGSSGTATLVNRDGLHARPASEFVKLAGRFDAKVTVNGVDARSLLRIMSLGLTAGSELRIEASGPEAAPAVAALVELVGSGFGE